MGKRLPQLYHIKMKISYDLGFYCNQSRHGNVMTPLRFYLSLFFLYEEFFKKLLKRVWPAIIASIMAKFERFLWQRFWNISKRSFKNQKKLWNSMAKTTTVNPPFSSQFYTSNSLPIYGCQLWKVWKYNYLELWKAG